MEFSMISPTEKGVRNDPCGSGYYRAKRGGRLHKGTDYLCVGGQSIYSPISGLLKREAKPYAKEEYSGCVIENEFVTIKMFYFKPFKDLIGKKVEQCQHIGFAQDISKKYSPKMLPHIHLEIISIDPNVFIRS